MRTNIEKQLGLSEDYREGFKSFVSRFMVEFSNQPDIEYGDWNANAPLISAYVDSHDAQPRYSFEVKYGLLRNRKDDMIKEFERVCNKQGLKKTKKDGYYTYSTDKKYFYMADRNSGNKFMTLTFAVIEISNDFFKQNFIESFGIYASLLSLV